MTGTVLGTLYKLSLLLTTLQDRYYHFHFINEEIEAQRSGITCQGPKIHSMAVFIQSQDSDFFHYILLLLSTMPFAVFENGDLRHEGIKCNIGNFFWYRIKLNESSEFQIKEAKECLITKTERKALKRDRGAQKERR